MNEEHWAPRELYCYAGCLQILPQTWRLPGHLEPLREAPREGGPSGSSNQQMWLWLSIGTDGAESRASDTARIPDPATCSSS